MGLCGEGAGLAPRCGCVAAKGLAALPRILILFWVLGESVWFFVGRGCLRLDL